MTAIAIAPSARSLHLTRRGRWLRDVVLLAGMGLLAVPALSRVEIALPTGTEVLAATAAAGRQVVVSEGESLWVIARREVPDEDPRSVITKIRALNHMTTNLIVPGQVLALPAT
jgi:nucleoid-associated protein YgaU